MKEFFSDRYRLALSAFVGAFVLIGLGFLFFTGPSLPKAGECFASKRGEGLYKARAVGKRSILADRLWYSSEVQTLVGVRNFFDEYELVDCPEDLEAGKK